MLKGQVLILLPGIISWNKPLSGLFQFNDLIGNENQVHLGALVDPFLDHHPCEFTGYLEDFSGLRPESPAVMVLPVVPVDPDTDRGLLE